MEAVERTYTVFAGDARLVSGDLHTTLPAAWQQARSGAHTPLFFEDWSGRQVDFDLRGSVEEAVERATAAHPAEDAPGVPRRGRPRLGVVSREVSLLPRHWEWLEAQPSGISAAIRRLVDEARKREPEKERARRMQETVSRVLTALAGDRPGYEEASRALFAGDHEGFLARIADWPSDVRQYLERLLRATLPPA